MYQSPMARWRSGYAEDCKSLYAGSIPVRASILIRFKSFIIFGFARSITTGSRLSQILDTKILKQIKTTLLNLI